MQKAYNILFKNDNIQDYYLEVSRRSLRVPIIWMDSKFETILDMISPSKLVSLNSIFECIGLDIDNYQDLISEFGFYNDSAFDKSKIKENVNLEELYKRLQPEVYKKSKCEYKELRRYILEKKIKDKFAIVDIGWSGGMQRYLDQTLDKLNLRHEIFGYYIGIADYFKRNTKVHSLNLEGYLFDFKNDKEAEDKRSSFVGLFETLFLEQDGSVMNYSYNEKEKKEVANRYPYEYIINGKKTRELQCVQLIQKGALDFIKDASKDKILTTVLNYKADELYAGIEHTGTSPNKVDLEMFANFHFYDDGINNFLANPQKISYYIFKAKNLKEDFLNSRWKIGFMKKLFKVNLPYDIIYKILHQFK